MAKSCPDAVQDRIDSRKGLLALVAALVTACGGGGDSSPAATTFVFRLHGMPATEEFRFSTASPQLIARARAQLSLPGAERKLIAAGSIAAGDGGHNAGWSWHFTNLSLDDAAIELCDGKPSMVEADLDYWLNTVKGFCPWASYVHAELR